MKLRITLLSLLTLFSFSALQAQCFEEQNGIVVVETESGNWSGTGWNSETAASPYTGSSYLAWRGSNYFNSPGNGVINYTIRINNPGTYRFMWRSKVGIIDNSHPNPSSEHNDSWLKIEASDFFAQSGSSIKYPIGSGKFPEVFGSGSGGWFKVFLSGTTNWTFNSLTSDNNGHFIYATFNSAGDYNLKISGRSNGHFIDRFVLFKESIYTSGQAGSLSLAQTTCGSGGNPPPPPPPPPPGENDPPTVSITSPANGANINTGSNVTVSLNSGDPNGNITKHEIFVNNTNVDTDGASYSPHIISNIQAGSYAIRAVVTDSNGATAEATVNITVGSGNPPPPPPPPSGGNNPPTVSITSPVNGANFNAGSNVTVNLSANDTDGSISQHEIFVNGTKVDTDGASYTPHIISNIAEGSYEIKAKVTDNSGATAETTINISVGGGNTPPPPPPPPPSGENAAPTVSITSPNDGQNFTIGSTVTVGVSASDTDGSITKHQVFVNNALVDTDGANFTPHYIPNISQGNYAIKVTVTDNEGATASATVNITVGSSNPPPPPPPPPPSGENVPPAVSITSPNDGQNFAIGSTVTVGVSASDTDGSITKHQVYVNNALVDTDGANFTPHYIANIAQGNYAIKVTVTDNEGATASATVNITVGSSNPPPPPPPPPSGGNISLTLVNTSTNADNGALTSGTNVSSGSNLNVRADVANSNVKSVFMQLSGATTRNQTENVKPYALFGDSAGIYASGTLNGGAHTLLVQGFSGLNRSGSILETLEISFTVASGGKSAIAYPNPVKQGNVNVKLPESITGLAGYAIISPSGTEVERGTVDASKMGDTKLLQIDSATMKNDGVYFLVIQANYDVFTVPIIKQ